MHVGATHGSVLKQQTLPSAAVSPGPPGADTVLAQAVQLTQSVVLSLLVEVAQMGTIEAMTTADESRRVNEKIAYDLRKDIDLGKLKADEKMPSVRGIADRFQVSPGTASKALQLLSKWGYTRQDSTRGYFVNAKRETEDETSEGNPEFAELMNEIAAIRSDMQGLSDRLRRLEEAAGPE